LASDGLAGSGVPCYHLTPSRLSCQQFSDHHHMEPLTVS
jgi:hypothetical protein